MGEGQVNLINKKVGALVRLETCQNNSTNTDEGFVCVLRMVLGTMGNVPTCSHCSWKFQSSWALSDSHEEYLYTAQAVSF